MSHNSNVLKLDNVCYSNAGYILSLEVIFVIFVRVIIQSFLKKAMLTGKSKTQPKVVPLSVHQTAFRKIL